MYISLSLTYGINDHYAYRQQLDHYSSLGSQTNSKSVTQQYPAKRKKPAKTY